MAVQTPPVKLPSTHPPARPPDRPPIHPPMRAARMAKIARSATVWVYCARAGCKLRYARAVRGLCMCCARAVRTCCARAVRVMCRTSGAPCDGGLTCMCASRMANIAKSANVAAAPQRKSPWLIPSSAVARPRRPASGPLGLCRPANQSPSQEAWIGRTNRAYRSAHRTAHH